MKKEEKIRALQTWAVLTVYAAKGRKMSYGELCHGLGYDPKLWAGRKTSPHLAQVQNFCSQEGAPPLTGIVGSEPNYEPGESYAGDMERLEADRDAVFAFPWHEFHEKFCEWLDKQMG